MRGIAMENWLRRLQRKNAIYEAGFDYPIGDGLSTYSYPYVSQQIDRAKLKSILLALVAYIESPQKPLSLENKVWRIRYWFHVRQNKKPLSYRGWRQHMRRGGSTYWDFLYTRYRPEAGDEFVAIAYAALVDGTLPGTEMVFPIEEA
jgi:hypothetical protein